MSILSDCLFDVVRGEYPDFIPPKSTAFRPMYSLDAGELSSTIAIEIAKVTKEQAGAIAERIILKLAGLIPAKWRCDNGYTVCSGVDTKVLLSEVRGSVSAALDELCANELTKRDGVIWCLMPDSTEPVYARLRLLARATLQALLSVVYSGPIRVSLYPGEFSEVRCVNDLLREFQWGVEWILERQFEKRIPQEFPNVVNPEISRLSIWTSHHYHDQLPKSFRDAFRLMRGGGKGRVTMPSDGWLRSRDRALAAVLEVKSIIRVVHEVADRNYWGRFLFHLASMTPSGDFDPAVALFDECSSPLWNMQSLVERFTRFKGVLPADISLETLSQSIHELTGQRSLVLSGLFLPVYTARAIVHNEVEIWCGVFERLAREGHAFINAPETRLALQNGAFSGEYLQIATGLGFGLSCILPLVAD